MRLSKKLIALYLGPAIFIYLAIFLYPTLRAAMMSFYDIGSLTDKMSNWKFVGLDNYAMLFNNSYFTASIWNVFLIWFLGGLIIFFFAFFYAIIINSGVRGKGFWRAIVYLPNTVSVVVMSVVWLHYVYNSRYGLLTTISSKLGVDSLASVQWTADENLFAAMLIAFCFGSIGYFMLILGAAMDRIPTDFYEAALLEGANVLHKFFYITLPLILDVFRTTLVLWTTIAINFFVWSAVFGWAMPEVMTPGYYMYLKVFGKEKAGSMEGDMFNVGMGAAIGVMITIAIIIISLLISKIFQRKERLEF